MKLDFFGDDGLARIEKSLDVLARRHEAIAANIANSDTPGYKTVDLQFRAELESELAGWHLVRTSPGHFDVVGPEPELKFTEVPGLPEGADGNNVKLDRELLAMTLNRLRFQMTAQWASSRFHALRSAIRGGTS